MEKIIKPTNGYAALILSLLLFGGGIFCFISTANSNQPMLAIPGALCMVLCVLIWKGLIIVQPNTARVLNLFGKYIGSVKDNGLFLLIRSIRQINSRNG